MEQILDEKIELKEKHQKSIEARNAIQNVTQKVESASTA
jgi:hypothetical protein